MKNYKTNITLFCFLVLCLVSSGSFATTYIKLESKISTLGKTVLVPVSLSNYNQVSAIQFEVTYDPVKLKSYSPSRSLTGNILPLLGNHRVFSHEAVPGIRKIIIVPDIQQSRLPSGEILYIPFKVISALTNADGAITLSPTTTMINSAGTQITDFIAQSGTILSPSGQDYIDSDGDGYSDSIELVVGTNPNDLTSVPSDSDKDFIPDSQDLDPDGDGNGQVDRYGNDPFPNTTYFDPKIVLNSHSVFNEGQPISIDANIVYPHPDSLGPTVSIAAGVIPDGMSFTDNGDNTFTLSMDDTWGKPGYLMAEVITTTFWQTRSHKIGLYIKPNTFEYTDTSSTFLPSPPSNVGTRFGQSLLIANNGLNVSVIFDDEVPDSFNYTHGRYEFGVENNNYIYNYAFSIDRILRKHEINIDSSGETRSYQYCSFNTPLSSEECGLDLYTYVSYEGTNISNGWVRDHGIQNAGQDDYYIGTNENYKVSGNGQYIVFEAIYKRFDCGFSEGRDVIDLLIVDSYNRLAKKIYHRPIDCNSHPIRFYDIDNNANYVIYLDPVTNHLIRYSIDSGEKNTIVDTQGIYPSVPPMSGTNKKTILLSGSGNYLYLLNNLVNKISRYSLSENFSETLDVEIDGQELIKVSEDGTHVFYRHDNLLKILDTETLQIRTLDTIDLADWTNMLHISSMGNAYVFQDFNPDLGRLAPRYGRIFEAVQLANLPQRSSVFAGQSITLDPLSYETSENGQPLRLLSVNFPDSNKATVNINANGTITYSPNWDMNGLDTFTFSFEDDTQQYPAKRILIQVNVSLDPDGDGINNDIDADDDNDGILDVDEPSTQCAILVDCDGDGVSDLFDKFIMDAGADADTDGDGIADNYYFVIDGVRTAVVNEWLSDTDDDNDGLTDAHENRIGSDPYDVDTDNDDFYDYEEVVLNMGNSDPLLAISGAQQGQQTYDLTWVNSLGRSSFYENTEATAVDGQGNVFLGGNFKYTMDFDPSTDVDEKTSGYYHDAFVTKFDASGNYMWTWQANGYYESKTYAIKTDSNNNVYVTGYYAQSTDFGGTTLTGNNFTTFIAKLDPNGNLLWVREIEGTYLDYGYDLAVDQNNNVYVGGFTRSTSITFDATDTRNKAGAGDAFITRINSDGSYSWSKLIGASGGYTYGYTVGIDASHVYFGGKFGAYNTDFGDGVLRSPTGYYDGFVVALSHDGVGSEGQVDWVWTASDEVTDLAITSSGLYIHGKYAGGSDEFDPNGSGNYITLNSGTNYWFTTHLLASNGSLTNDVLIQTNLYESKDIATDANNNLFITGTFQVDRYFDSVSGTDMHYTNGYQDVFISKYTPGLIYDWTKTFGGTSSENAMDVAVGPSGGVYLAGEYFNTVDFDPTDAGIEERTSQGSRDLFVMGFDSSGSTPSIDSDGDGIPDDIEQLYGMDPNDVNDAALDLDEDGLSNLKEYQLGSKLHRTDSDLDGLTDQQEVMYGTNLVYSDSDDDGLSDIAEIQIKSNPLVTDSDRDGIDDGVDSNPVGDKPLYSHGQVNHYGWPLVANSSITTNAIGHDGSVYTYMQINTYSNSSFVNMDFSNRTVDEWLLDPSGYDQFIVKTDAQGNYQWTYRVPNTQTLDMGRFPGYDNWNVELETDRNGNVFITGLFSGTVDFQTDKYLDGSNSTGAGVHDAGFTYDRYLMKIDPNGQYLWSASFAGESSNSIGITGSGNASGGDIAIDKVGDVFVSGGLSNKSDSFLAKISTNGELIWNLVQAGETSIGSINAKSDGFVITTSSDYSVISKYDTQTGVGIPLYNVSSSNDGSIQSYDVDSDDEGNIFIVGRGENGVVDFGGVGNSLNFVTPNMFMLKIDAVGNTLWVRKIYSDNGIQKIYWSQTYAFNFLERRNGLIAVDGQGDVYLTSDFTGFNSKTYQPTNVYNNDFVDEHYYAGDSDWNHAQHLTKYYANGDYAWSRYWQQSNPTQEFTQYFNSKLTLDVKRKEIYLSGLVKGACNYDTDNYLDLCEVETESSFIFKLIVDENYNSISDYIDPTLDWDGDGYFNDIDAFNYDASEWIDTDNDGIGDNADNDNDNDGVEDSLDAFPLDPSESMDTDVDGVGNNADTDDDNDGLSDIEENTIGSDPLLVDTDNDGFSDYDEYTLGLGNGDPLVPVGGGGGGGGTTVGNYDLAWINSLGRSSFYENTGATAIDSQDNVFLGGNFKQTMDFDPSSGGVDEKTSGYYHDAFVTKFDAIGNYLWTWQANGYYESKTHAIKTDSNNNVYVTGYYAQSTDFGGTTLTGNNFTAFLAKLDSNGNLLWVREIEGTYLDYGYDIAVDQNNNAYVGGFTRSTSITFDATDTRNKTGAGDAFITRINSDGSYGWSKLIGASGGYTYGNAVSVDANLVYLGGKYGGYNTDFGDGVLRSPTGYYDGFVVALSRDGVGTEGQVNWVWTASDEVTDLAITSTGLYVHGKYSGGSDDFDPNGSGKNITENTGATYWFTTHLLASNGSMTDDVLMQSDLYEAKEIATDADDNLFITGTFQVDRYFDSVSGTDMHYTNGYQDVFISKYTSGLIYDWTKTFGGTSSENVRDVAVGPSGGVYLAGEYFNTVDFDPTDAGIEERTSQGSRDLFVIGFR